MASIDLMFLFLTVFCSLSFTTSFAEISRKELRSKKVNMEAVIQLNHIIQHNRVDPSRATQLSWRPRVFLYRGLLSDAECDHLILLAKGQQEDLSSNDGDSGNTITSRPFITSETLLSTEDKVTASVEERISAWTFLPKENSNSILVKNYGLEEANQKYNFFSNKPELHSSPLFATVILFLSNITKGGGILFPESEFNSKSKILSDCTNTKSDNVLRPIKGNAILFFSLYPNVTSDKSSSHGRCPVLDGEMWCATKYFHVSPLAAISQSDGSECTDEDDNCSHWAAVGECQRNPVYMIGSPDYFGTCRKSCKAC